MGGFLDRVLELFSGLEALLRRAPRRALVAAAGALVIVVVCVSLLVAQMQPNPAQTTARLSAQHTATSTSTDTPTATATATTVSTAARVPTPKPVPKTPPPPPMPPPTPTRPPVTPTAALCPTYAPPTPTTTAGASPTASGTATSVATCPACPWYTGNNPSQSTLQQYLDDAAKTYGIPAHLVEAVAWQESKWHADVTSCDGGLGLMQIQYNDASWFNSLSIPECNITATSYSVQSAKENALLGAKVLAYLACYWSYWGGWSGKGYSLSNPATYTVDWYYQQAGLPYPDTSRTPSACQTVYNNTSTYPEYQAMSSSIATPYPWSCPYDPTKQPTDSTLLDVTVSAYNAGPGAVNGGIPNPGYVANVESFIPQFASGALPVPS
jgi:soluble lytic murein transglycosylase-like protein